MLKPNYQNILLYIIIKLNVFLTVLAIKKDSWHTASFGEAILYYISIVVPITFLSVILFLFPLYYAFKQSRFALFAIYMALFFAADYLFYSMGTSSKLGDNNAAIYTTVSAWVFLILFYRIIKSRIELIY